MIGSFGGTSPIIVLELPGLDDLEHECLTFAHPLVFSQDIASRTFAFIRPISVYTPESTEQRILGTLVYICSRGSKKIMGHGHQPKTKGIYFYQKLKCFIVINMGGPSSLWFSGSYKMTWLFYNWYQWGGHAPWCSQHSQVYGCYSCVIMNCYLDGWGHLYRGSCSKILALKPQDDHLPPPKSHGVAISFTPFSPNKCQVNCCQDRSRPLHDC